MKRANEMDEQTTNRNATIFKERDHLGLVCCGCTNDKTAFGSSEMVANEGQRESQIGDEGYSCLCTIAA